MLQKISSDWSGRRKEVALSSPTEILHAFDLIIFGAGTSTRASPAVGDACHGTVDAATLLSTFVTTTAALGVDKDFTIPGHNGYIDRQAAKGAYVVGAGDAGQTGEPSYYDRQRAPGDWDCWVSQGAITVHGREHLATSDRGVTLFRKLQGITI